VPQASNDDIRREVMGTLLGTLALWTQFATWTFSRPVTVAGAMHLGMRHLRWLARWDVDTERGPSVPTTHNTARVEARQQEFLWAPVRRADRSKKQCGSRKNGRDREKAATERLQAFLATERGGTGGLLHLHALVAGITHLRAFCGVCLPREAWGRKCCMVHAWPCGHARVFPYDPALGARHYVSKYVIKGHLAEWTLLGDFCCPGKACSSALH
jgi:hypothetical protein